MYYVTLVYEVENAAEAISIIGDLETKGLIDARIDNHEERAKALDLPPKSIGKGRGVN